MSTDPSHVRQRKPPPPNKVVKKAEDTDDASKRSNHTSTTSRPILIVHLYSIIWCCHYIIPYLDHYLYQSTRDVVFDYGKKHLKFIPALDHRPIDVTVLDRYVLLPLVLYILYLYLVKYRNDIFTTNHNSHSIHDDYLLRMVYIGHVVDTIVIRGIIRMPYVWDHEQWASLCNLMFIACYTQALFFRSKTTTTHTTTTTATMTQWWLQQEGLLLGILYGAAAFWKLTTSFWYHTTTSCGASLVLETILTYYVPGETVPMPLAQLAVDAGPYLTFTVEAGISLGMLYLAGTSRMVNTGSNDNIATFTTRNIIRKILIVMAIGFHLTIYMLPVNAAGGFSLDCMTRLIFFLHPQEVHDALVLRQPSLYAKISRYRVWMICLFVWIRYKGTGYPMDFGFLFYGLVLDLYIMILFPSSSINTVISKASPSKQTVVPSVTKILSNGMILAGLVYGVGLTILGLEQMGAPTMYSNLRSYYGGNHLLVPTGILGDDILYGGRLVQVTYSTCDFLNQMLGYIDSAEIEPESLYSYQKLLLRNASIPNTPIQNQNLPIQFLPLCMGNPHSKQLLIDYYRKSNPIGQPVPFQFILPINVVKRALHTARQRKETFVVKIADGGRSSELKEPPILKEGDTEVIAMNEQGECSVEFYQATTLEQNSNVHTIPETFKSCHEQELGQLLLADHDSTTWMSSIVSKLLIPYPQIVGESEEVCMS